MDGIQDAPMKTLYLLRHAKSSWSDPTLADFDRPLKGRGRRAAKAMGAYLAECKICPDLILCSGSERTRQTLDLVLKAMGKKVPHEFDDTLYHGAPSGLLRVVHAQDDGLGSLMLVGHNPGMEQLAWMLSGEADERSLDTMRVKFPTGALAVLTSDVERWSDLKRGGARLESFVRPVDLEG